MSVTNMIKDNVDYDNLSGWNETPLDNEEIIEALIKEKKKSFLSFAYGVWVTAYARSNLLKNVIKLDEYVAYCDTDSMKLVQGYDKKVIDEYNDFVQRKIKFVSKALNIPIYKYSPKDKKGNEHMLGLFECETDKGRTYTYDEFITQGAKKYAVKKGDEIEITVSGVPKKGAKALKDLHDFKDDFVFRHEDTNKNLLIYCDSMNPTILTDYLGNETIVEEKRGCCIVPTTYVLGKALDYAHLISDDSSPRARYKE